MKSGFLLALLVAQLMSTGFALHAMWVLDWPQAAVWVLWDISLTITSIEVRKLP
jgi:hypothetical protein